MKDIKTKLISANIKSEKEAIERLMNGEVFYDGDNRITYSDRFYYRFSLEILTYVSEGAFEYIPSATHNVNFNRIQFWCIKKQLKWYDNIPEQGILCRVADKESNLSNTTEILRFAVIKKYDENREYLFRESESFGWKFAIPIKSDDPLIIK